ncbi:MAG TPA: autotransporter-associated beta strand repeat-containing protein [Rariglobus sp.]
MKSFITLVLAAALASTPLFAGRYGSESVVTLSGAYHLPGTTATSTLKNQDVATTTKYLVRQIGNGAILDALKNRQLISATSGYSLVMVGQTDLSDGTGFFVVRGSETPVAVPTDILTLQVLDGPNQGSRVVSAQSVLKTLAVETRNYAKLVLPEFEGYGILVQSWKARPYSMNGISEVVELVTTTGTLAGTVQSGDLAGVGSIKLTLTKAKVVDLTRYGMATTAATNTTAGATTTQTESTVVTPAVTPVTDTASGATAGSLVKTGNGSLTLSGSNSYSGGTMISGGLSAVLAIDGNLYSNTSPMFNVIKAPGLTLTVDGAESTSRTLTSTLFNELSINTANGLLVFTRETGDLWTPVVPAP